jgi:hypothetical protein
VVHVIEHVTLQASCFLSIQYSETDIGGIVVFLWIFAEANQITKKLFFNLISCDLLEINFSFMTIDIRI